MAAIAGAELISYGIGARGPDPQPWSSWPLGDAIDFVLGPLVRWDARYYLGIATDGYRPDVEALRGARAFFPVYPLLVRGLGGFASTGAAALAAIAVSLAAFWGGLRLLHRLAAIELDRRTADATVLLLAFAPVSFFFSAPYTESLFLLLSVGAFLAARTGRWALAGVAAGLASGTRPTGALLILPLAILYLYGPRADRPGSGRHPVRPNALWLALAPAGVVAYSLYQRHAIGDALAWQHIQPFFGRTSFEWPTETLRQSAVAAWDAIAGDGRSAYRGPILVETAYLPVVVAGIVGAFRRLPFAYGAYATAAFLVAIASPAYVEPLRSLPRLMLPVFPIVIWLAAWTEDRRITRYVVAGSAVALALLTAAFASWQPYV
ncbi:MAG TPA: mannosyltransferase family protein [Thermoleophilaceae bacterium]|nr:mannosyltransferase family protein [Thermoleophilaceae bacterium]